MPSLRARERANARAVKALGPLAAAADGLGRFGAAFQGRFNPDHGLDQETRKLQEDFRTFLKVALPLVVPGGEIKWSFHLDAMADHLQAISDRRIKNLIMVLPPRCLKSTTLVCWSAWEWTRDPTIRRLCTSYDKELAQRDNGAVRDLIAHPWYAERWGDRVIVRPDIDNKGLFQLTSGGRRLVSSIGSRGTGEGGTRVEVDDAHNVLKAESETDRQRAIDWWLGTMSSRVNSADSAKIVTGQRVHYRDLIGSLVAQMVESDGEVYERLILPMEYDPKLIVRGAEFAPRAATPPPIVSEPETNIRENVPDSDVSPHGYYRRQLSEILNLDDELFDPDGFDGATVQRLPEEDRPLAGIPYRTAIGFVDPRTVAGQLLCPEQWPLSEIRVRRIQLGPYRYAAQYQGMPTPTVGGQFKEHYWARYEFQAMWHRGLRASIIAVDSAYGEEHGDPTGVAVWGEYGGRLYVLEAIELTLETPQLRTALRDLHSKWKAPFLIENKANGKALIQDLRHGSDSGALPSLPVIPYDPDGMTKEGRAYAVVSYIAGGLVFLPQDAPWADAFITQHKEFPKGLHDDLVDTTAMSIRWLKEHSASIRDIFTTPIPAPYGQRMRVARDRDTSKPSGRWSY